MASIIRIKRSPTSGNPAILAQGELSYSYLTDNGGNGGDRLYIGTGTETAGDAANHEVIGGKYYVDLLGGASGASFGVVTANQALVVDSDKKLNEILIDNVTIDGNTISTSTGNLVLSPTGFVDANTNLIKNVGAPVDSADVATKQYVDDQVIAGSGTVFQFNDGTTSRTYTAANGPLEFIGGTGITTQAVDSDTLNISLTDVVTGTTIGSSTQIPVLTINNQGQVTTIDSATISTALSIAGDAGADTVNVGTDTLTVAGGTGLSSTVTDNNITIDLDSTGVTPTTYGSTTSIPVITVNAQGQLTTVTTASISTDLTVNNDTISLADSDLTFAAGEGLDITVDSATNTITYSGEDATTSNKGIASFTAADFGVTSGAVSLADTVVKSVATDGSAATPSTHSFGIVGASAQGVSTSGSGANVTVTVQDATTANKGVASFSSSDFSVSSGAVSIASGGVSNAQLANSSITIGSDAISLGASRTDINGLTSLDVDNITIDGNTISTTTGALTLDPANAGDSGDVIILGNLTVNGTTTTINSTEVTINDLTLTLADSATNSTEANGAGLIVAGANAEFTYASTGDKWTTNKTLDVGGSGLLIGGVTLDETIDDRVSSLLLAGEGVDLTYNDGADTLTISAELATVTNPGVASFDSDQMTVTSGFVTIVDIDGGTY